MKKFRFYFLVTFCLFLIVVPIFFVFYSIENPGIQSLRFYNKNDKVCLKIKYVDCWGYCVETLKNNDMIIIGERDFKASDFIGENAIEISLYDSDMSNKLKKDYNYFEVYNVNLKNAKTNKSLDIRFMLCPSADHALKIYVGFEENFKTFVTEHTKTNIPIGTIYLELGEDV